MQFKVINPLDSGKLYFNRRLYLKVVLVVCISLIWFSTTNLSCSQVSSTMFKDFLLFSYRTIRRSSSTILTIILYPVLSTSDHSPTHHPSLYYGLSNLLSPQQNLTHPSRFRPNFTSYILWTASVSSSTGVLAALWGKGFIRAHRLHHGFYKFSVQKLIVN